MDYLIYSLPRSGSAWLSTFLSNNRDGLCYHDPTPSILSSLPYAYSGAICTYAHRILPPRAESRFALIRDPEQIQLSFNALNLPNSETPASISDFNFITGPLPKIYYDELFNVEYLRKVWEMVIGRGFNPAWAERMIELRVTVNPVRVAARLLKEGNVPKFS